MRKIGGLVGLLLLAVLFASTPSSQQLGHTLYVNKTDPTCQNKSPCFTTIQAAVNAAFQRDSIQIQAGTYVERLTIEDKNNVSGASESSRIVIEADPALQPGSVVLKPPPAACLNGHAVLIRRSKFVTLRGLTITGAVGAGVVLVGGVQQNQAIHIERGRIVGNSSAICPGGGIVVALGNPETLIVNTLIYGNGGNGITFADPRGGPHWLVQNTIHGNGWNGVSIVLGNTVTLVNNLITGNGRASGTLGGRQGVRRTGLPRQTPEAVDLLNNLICGNRLGEIQGPILDSTDSGNLTPQGSEGSGVSASPGCEFSTNVYVDPDGRDNLPNTADDDFRLVSNSPAIDKGMDSRTLALNVLFNSIFEADFSMDAARPSDGNGDRNLVFDIGAFEFPNERPVANAGPDQSVFRGILVTIDGSQSHDPEGASLTYRWTFLSQPSGSSVTLNDPTSAKPQFTPLVLGNYVFQLVVNDGESDSASDSVQIAVVNRSPTANAGGPYSGQVKAPIQFSGSGTDPDGDAITFSWDFGDGGVASGATPTHTYTSPGTFTVTLTVSDSPGASAISQTTATLSAALVLNPIGNKTVKLGETLTFTVIASSPSSPTNLFVSPLPLPNHATFNAATGLFTFTPDTTQVGSFQLTFTAVSGDQSASETITITVPSAPPGGTTAVRGRVYNLNNTPLGNVKVTLKSSGHTAFSANDGFFTITGTPSGRQELIVNGREANLGVFAILAVPVNLIEGVLNNLGNPITLPDVDTDAEVQVNPNSTTIITNPNVPGVVLTIFAATAKNSDGTPFTGKLSINPVPDYGRPESRPEELRPGMAITIQPAGIRFNPPATLTFPNADGMPPGSELNLWSLSPDTGTFSIVGRSVVTANGQSIITAEGGVTASAWHFPLAPSGSSNTDVDESEGLVQDPTKQCQGQAGSTVALHSGCLEVDFSPPSYRSLGISRSLKFVYKSNRANPQPLIPFNATIPVRAAVPPRLSYSLSVGGVEQGTETFINTSGLDENRDETIRGVASFDASQLKTGVYPYRIKLTSNYLNSSISSFISDRVLVVNEQKSFLGAGWGIEGMGKLDFSDDGTIIFTDGSGTAIAFSGGPNTFASPPSDFSTLVRNPDGSFIRSLKDGTKINFNSSGLQTSVIDRNGNTTSYSYDGSGRLTSITDPAKLTTTLSYTGERLSSVIDPAGRTTFFQHDAAGNLVRVTFPDGTSKSFGYDSRNLMISETNERGFVVQREYDGAGRLLKVTLPDGSVRTARSAQSAGFTDLTTGVGTITNPAPVVRPADALSRFTDGRSNQQTVKIGKFGAPSRITDSLGQTTLIERRIANDGTLQNGASFASGRVGEAFTFDGVDDMVVVPDNPSLKPAQVTVSAWVRFASLDGRLFGGAVNFPGLQYIVFKRNSRTGNFEGYTLIKFRASGIDRFSFNVASASSVQTGATSATAVVAGQWYHLTGTYDGSTVRLYVNGTLQVQVFHGFPLDHSTQPLVIGRSGQDGDPGEATFDAAMNGNVDEVQVFSRALSASEIQALFTAGNVGNRTAPPVGLVSWWQGEGNAIDSAGGNGLPTKITRPNGAVTSMTYDPKGNVLTSTDPVGATTTFTYDPSFNQIKTIRDPKGNTTTINYDAKGNPIEIIDALGNRTQMTYDTRGLFTSVTSAVGSPVQNTTSFTYDVRGNLLTTTDPKGNVTTLTYDNAGDVIRSTDAEGRVTEFDYDPMNRLISVLDPQLQLTTYVYDLKGNLAQVADAKNQVTTFAYDQRDRLSSATNPLGFTESFTYDANGNLTSTTNRNGQTITFNYDVINRLTKKSRPPVSTEVGSQVMTFTYDSVSNLNSVVDPDATINMAYDLANRLTSTTASSPSMPAKMISYNYDLNGNRTRMTDPQSGVSTYVYDSLNRLTSITNPSGRVTSFTFDSLGRRTSMTHSNGVVTTYSYDAASQLTRLAHQLGAATINSFDYTYDKVGNRKNKTSRDGVHSYTYDSLNRLTEALNPLPSNPLESFTYDPVGNRANSNQNGASTFNQVNQLLEDASFTYQYDNNGNLTRKTNKATSAFTSYEYDAENKLVRVVNNGTVINYRYDGLARRVQKEIIDAGTRVTRYIYDNEDIVLELDGSNNIVARYTQGPSIDEPLIMEKAGAIFFYHADGLRSITEITNASGIVAQWYSYSSFGRIESQLDPNFVQPYTFTAREFDAELDVYFYRARYYGSTTGRFLQEDPVLHAGNPQIPYMQPSFLRDPLLLHTYAYVRNDPVNKIDPLGLAVIISRLNGNFKRGFSPQDSICTVPSRFEFLNENSCTKGCCQEHDDCYTKYGCNASSWYATLVGNIGACQFCNVKAVTCVWGNLRTSGCGCQD